MSGFRLYTVRVLGPAGQSATPHYVDGEDAALDAMARADGYPSFRAWQSEHPEESGWSVAVEVSQPDNSDSREEPDDD